jgi:hypothetical protein
LPENNEGKCSPSEKIRNFKSQKLFNHNRAPRPTSAKTRKLLLLENPKHNETTKKQWKN